MRTILLIAAEGREFAGLLRHCRGVARLPWRVDFARSAEVDGLRLLMVANGPGPKLAGEAMAVALCGSRPDAVVSTGFCGALDATLGVGDVLVASSVRRECEEYGAAVPLTSRAFRTSPLISTGRVVGSASEKRLLRASGAAAVDMEAAAVAKRAGEAGLRFYCVRVVLDRADEGFCLDFEQLRSSDGRYSRPRILRAALRRPARSLPQLIRLERRARVAARALGDFLADCQF